ncbi:hypothetical protein [Liquorilactobacillus capillatus]|uniref:O-acetyltransferase n=1 Tax=Liquorilactobacillus capillatus DSM 19910 TaxID=1423731 RepID=A0A0R1MA44_9LACO|nr:hypothetical protein [Liquorilactobacillus capillatus]KRL01722.1 O-acetyltransferase [Liquorilactobacillus capillatus DSM 19910]
MGLTRNTILASFYGLGTPVHLSLFGGIQIPAIGVIWFLVTMYCGNMLFNASLKIGTYFNKQVVIVLVLSLLESILGFVIARRLALPWSFNAALVSQIFYCGGYLIRYLKLMENKNPVYFLGGLILWGVSVHSGFFYLNTAFANAPVLAILGALGGSFVLMKLAQAMISFNWKLSLLRNYGQLSLIVMCFHLIDITLLHISGFIYNELTMIHVTPILVVCAVICYRLLFTILAVLIIPHIPLLRSFYLNRRFPVVNPKLGIISKRLF